MNSALTEAVYMSKHHDDTLSRFNTIPECCRQTDGQTEYMSLSHSISVLTHDKTDSSAIYTGVITIH